MHKVLYTALSIFLVQLLIMVWILWPAGMGFHHGHVKIIAANQSDSSFTSMETNLRDMKGND